MNLFQQLTIDQKKSYVFFGALGCMALGLLIYAGWMKRPQLPSAYAQSSGTALVESRVVIGRSVR